MSFRPLICGTLPLWFSRNFQNSNFGLFCYPRVCGLGFDSRTNDYKEFQTVHGLLDNKDLVIINLILMLILYMVFHECLNK